MLEIGSFFELISRLQSNGSYTVLRGARYRICPSLGTGKFHQPHVHRQAAVSMQKPELIPASFFTIFHNNTYSIGNTVSGMQQCIREGPLTTLLTQRRFRCYSSYGFRQGHFCEPCA
jgi:hypothetical protein